MILACRRRSIRILDIPASIFKLCSGMSQVWQNLTSWSDLSGVSVAGAFLPAGNFMAIQDACLYAGIYQFFLIPNLDKFSFEAART